MPAPNDYRMFGRGFGAFIVLLLIALVAVAFFAGRASAEPLALIHDASTTCKDGGFRNACSTGRIDIPKPGDLVALCPDVSNCWIPEPVMQSYEKVPPQATIDGCDNPLAQRGAPLVLPWTTANDPCKGWHAWPAITFAVADLSKFESSSVGGVAPQSLTLTWDVLGVDTCTASGSWTGTKPTKGTQSITGLTANARYVLTCASGQVLLGNAALSWQAPLTNVDTTPLTDLAGFRIVYGMAADALTSVIEIKNPAVSTYTVNGLTAGQTWYFAMRAFNAAGAESTNSGVASKAIAPSPGKQWTKTIDVAVTPAPTVPKPPTGLKVTQVTAYRLDQPPNAPQLVAIGSVPLGTQCYDELLLGKNRIDNATVKLDRGRSRPNVALATCSAAF